MNSLSDYNIDKGIVKIDTDSVNQVRLVHEAIHMGEIDSLWYRAPLSVKMDALLDMFEIRHNDVIIQHKRSQRYSTLSPDIYRRLSVFHRTVRATRQYKHWWRIHPSLFEREHVETDYGFATEKWPAPISKFDHSYVIPTRLPLSESKIIKDLNKSIQLSTMFYHLFSTLEITKYTNHLPWLETEIHMEQAVGVEILIYYAASRFWGKGYMDTLAKYTMINSIGDSMAYTFKGDVFFPFLGDVELEFSKYIDQDSINSKDAKFNSMIDYTYALSLYEVGAMANIVHDPVTRIKRGNIGFAKIAKKRAASVPLLNTRHNLLSGTDHHDTSSHFNARPIMFEKSFRFTVDKVLSWVQKGNNLEALMDDKFIDVYYRLIKEVPLFDFETSVTKKFL